jgi:hypothetical protein
LSQLKNHGGISGKQKENQMAEFVNIPRNPLLDPMREVTEAEQIRREKYGDLATAEIAVNDDKGLVQVILQDPTVDEDALVLQTTKVTVCGTMIKTLGAKLLGMGRAVQVFDGK